jgi:hypothetical protein
MHYRSFVQGLLDLVQAGGHFKAFFIASFQSFFQKFNFGFAKCFLIFFHIIANQIYEKTNAEI